jgi:hypothetical protein
LNRRRGDFAQPGHAVPDNNSAATIHLKNGRMIHADTAHETADKVEYSIGESDYQIPKSLVQEIVRTVETPSNPQNGGTDVQLSVQAQPNHSPCKRKAVSSDVKIPCYTGFWVSVLMGLGETQRFALFDNAGHDVTAQAEWAILDYGSQVDFSVINGVPHIFSKKYGMVTLYATVGDNSAMAQIYVSKPDEITSNTLGRKGAPAFLDSHRPLQLVPAEPYIGRIQ